MPLFTEVEPVVCPYCGEQIEIIVDGSNEQQSYTEDCSVCCRPMEVTVTVIGDAVAVSVRREDD